MTAAANSGDSAWLIAAAALALLAALPGLGLHAAGRLTAGAAARAAAGALVATAAVSIGWGSVGYSLAFGTGGALIGGLSNALLGGFAPLLEPFTVSEAAFALYQLVLATLAAVIVAGAGAGRAGLGWLGGFTLLWSVFAYAPIARALGGDGLLGQLGVIDYAGGAAVHVSAGSSALVVALMLGRTREPEADRSPALALLGAALVWVGWFGVAGGASFSGGEDAAFAILNSHLAAATGALVWGALARRGGGLAGLGNGAIAGLAAAASGAGFIGAGGALALGAIGAGLAYGATRLLRGARLGDPLDVVAVHGLAGAVGVLLAPLFMLEALGGLGLPEGATLSGLLAVQAITALAVALWAAVATAIAGFMAAALFEMRFEERQSAVGSRQSEAA